MGSSRAPSDAELARLAGALRVLTIDQLRDAHLGRTAMRHRVDQGRLRRLMPRVYLVGPGDPQPLTWARAATLGRDAYVSEDWAAHVHGFAPPPRLPVDVLVVSGSRRGVEGKVLAHRSRILEPHDLGTIGEIPATSAARALLDIGAGATLARLEALVARARVARAVTVDEL